MNTFDPVAHDFESFRAFPAGVAGRIRDAILTHIEADNDALILDVGAGTGRVGEAFVARGDRYVGVDLSGEMLARFGEKIHSPETQFPRLAQADARALPFADQAFDVVLLVHVVSNIPGWRRLVDESKRVLNRDGTLMVGQVSRPVDGLDARMNAQLDIIAESLGMPPRRSKTQKHDARRELASAAQSHSQVTTATWEATRSPALFLERKPTGGRFAALAPELRDDALAQLAAWAETTLGSIDAPIVEEHAFLCDFYRF